MAKNLTVYYEVLAQAAEKELPTPVILELAKLLRRKELEGQLFGKHILKDCDAREIGIIIN